MEELEVRIQEWLPLLQILQESPSPVGAAMHWVESQGRCSSLGSRKRGASVATLWKLIPDLLAWEVVFTQEGTLGDCIWMQTLPCAMQANILAFLVAQCSRFRSGDLEKLAKRLLSSHEVDFWVYRGAKMLLDFVSANASVDIVPLYKCNAVSAPVNESWFPCPEQKIQESGIIQECMTECDPLLQLFDELKTTEGMFFSKLQPLSEEVEKVDIEAKQVLEDNTISSLFDQHEKRVDANSHKDNALVPVTEAENEAAIPAMEMDEQSVITGEKDIRITQEDPEVTIGTALDVQLHSQALSLREMLLAPKTSISELDVAKGLCIFRLCPDLVSLFNTIKPWEMEDNIILLFINHLLGEQEGYMWSIQVVSFTLFPKLLELKHPASRALTCAVMMAAKTHPKVILDALLVPLMLRREGASSFQCDMINRVLKELPADTLAHLSERLFCEAEWQDEKTFHNLYAHHNIVRSLTWNEPIVGVIQTLLNQQPVIDTRILDGLISSLKAVVGQFKESLKFATLLLNMLSKHGVRVKAQKHLLESIAGSTSTFMTKSILAKLSKM